MSAHTPASPLPWRFEDNTIYGVSHGRWYQVVTVKGMKHTAEANAENAAFIVTACNSHADLVAALQLAVATLHKIPSEMGNDSANLFPTRYAEPWAEQAIAALAKAGV